MYIYVGDELLGLKKFSFNENIATNRTPKVELNRKLFTNIVSFIFKRSVDQWKRYSGNKQSYKLLAYQVKKITCAFLAPPLRTGMCHSLLF